MRSLNQLFLFVFCIISAVTCHADFTRLFTPGGKGSLPEKLIVTDENALLYEKFLKSPTRVKPLTVLWRLKDKKANDPNNPVVTYHGKKYYCVGSPDGEEWGYIETTKVTRWRTRFVYTPLPSYGDRYFRVFNKYYSKREFLSVSSRQIEDATTAKVSGVPSGNSSFVYILDGSGVQTSIQKIQGRTIDPYELNKVMMYAPVLSTGASGGKTDIVNLPQIDVGLDVVFVIDTTSGMQPMIDMIKKVCVTLKNKVNNSNKDRDIIHFGLIEYRDSEYDFFGARVICDLTESYDTFLRRLNALKSAGGGDRPDDVLLGLKLAVEKSKWHKYTRKHVILVGDSPNKATHAAGTITNFRQLYNYANGRLVSDVLAQKYQRIIFHAVDGGSSPATASEFSEIANNNGKKRGFYGNMSRNPKVANELFRSLSKGINELMDDPESSKVRYPHKKFLGYASARTYRNEKCASLNILILRSEMEDFSDALSRAYRCLDKLFKNKDKNVEDIFDLFLEEYVGIVSGTAMDDDYEKSLDDILGLQMPVKTEAFNLKLKDVIQMNEKERKSWLKDIKDAHDRVKTILNQKERWVETYHVKGERGQEYVIIPVEDLP